MAPPASSGEARIGREARVAGNLIGIMNRTFQQPALSFTPMTGALLQRKCACGGTLGPTGECEACHKKREAAMLQRAASHTAVITEVPPIVHDVLRSPGQPLDSTTRAFMEPRFGHDFSQVRIHTNARAAESAQAVNALAYTSGNHVVLGAGKHATDTLTGQRLLAHELTHVVQQSSSTGSPTNLWIGSGNDHFEQEADRTAAQIIQTNTSAPNYSAIQPIQQADVGRIQRTAIHKGNILDEGSCKHLACNSKYACEDNVNGITCPTGTRNASETKKYRPLFTCDTKCENSNTCSDNDNWMAIPHSRFARSKCSQDLVICANGKFTHASVRDRSDREAWEVSHGIQDSLGVSPYAKFKGAIYGDEADGEFKKDTLCHSKTAESEKTGKSLENGKSSND